MRTKVLNFVLPAVAIIMAVGLAFATEEGNTTRPGYYDHPVLGAQPVPGGVDCETEGTIICKYGTYDVFADEGLNDLLYEPQE